MWVIAGVLLGLVVLGTLLGFHLGPHGHLVAAVFGVVAAAWLVAMAIDGRSSSVLWALLTADVVISAGVGILAWKAITADHEVGGARHLISPESAVGVAVDDLDPDGLVRVHGETWSATAVNGHVAAGTAIQVLKVVGVRLEVWGEETVDEAGGALGPPAATESAVEEPANEVRSEGGRS